MIKRKYFFSVKVSHDNNSGLYSWYSGIVTKVSWFKDEEDLIADVRGLGCGRLQGLVERDIVDNDVQVLALNRL